MTVVLDNDMGISLFDISDNLTEHSGATDTCHIFEAYFLRAAFDELVCQIAVVLHGVHLRVGDTHSGLRGHTGFFRPFDRGDDVTRVVQTAEDAGDVRSLCVLDLVHQPAHVCRDGVHTEGVQATIEHVGLDTSLVERLGTGANRQIGILAIEEIDLFGCSAIGFYSVETAHIDYHGGYFG